MSSDARFGDEPSMAEILASVRKIVAEDTVSEGKTVKIQPEITQPSGPETSNPEPSSKSDILQRLLNKQAELEKPKLEGPESLNSPASLSDLVADRAVALGFTPDQRKPTQSTKATVPSAKQPVEPSLTFKGLELEEDEIQILDLVDHVAEPTTSKESDADLNSAIQQWAEGPGNALIRKMIKEEISALFRDTFKV